MPRIFDNIKERLLPTLKETLQVSYRADFCVGYFNLRGWKQIDAQIDEWVGGENYRCRLLVGMQRPPKEQLKALFALGQEEEGIDNQTALKLKKELADEFRQQLMLGAPTNADEAGLRRLAQQIREGKVVVKLFLHHPLHAKLYLLYRNDLTTPRVGFMGSSNLTFSGLAGQGELNIDVVDQDATQKLSTWFEDRWKDRWCIDISQELVQIIEESWASERPIPPYYIYLKMAYHLSREARAGLSEFTIPKELDKKLFDFQAAAVKIAARHLNQRGGVLIGDVVGLGKTLMATALLRIFEEDFEQTALILCPKNLVKMWESYRDEYHLRAKVLSVTRVSKELPTLPRYRLLLIDESHNLRNREGKRYRAIQEYIRKNDSRCILLSATPYNKSYLDLSSQLRLFVPEGTDLGIRPEQLLREIGEVEFSRRHQASLRSLAAFEKSEHADDWRELMRLFMVRRTRTFIRENYAETEPENGRKFLAFSDGRRAYFPDRLPRSLAFAVDESNPLDSYARMYSELIVNTINDLNLPRYGLGNYVHPRPKQAPDSREQQLLDNLSRGGRRLMGFSRTNLFKRLESSGYAFLLSVERHLLRNYIFIHALENGLALPIGTQGAELLDTSFEDEDVEWQGEEAGTLTEAVGEVALRERAAAAYALYLTQYRKRFQWIRPDLFDKRLLQALQEDSAMLLSILQQFGQWSAAQDAKLNALHELLTRHHAQDKVLIFSQFADTVLYLNQQLQARGLTQVAGATGSSVDPTALAWRFSPRSNGKQGSVAPEQELRVLIATDVLSEGQNLQDSHIVVNYDLPWAIIRLIQRAGRVDRIGQEAEQILSYTFWPADGVNRIIGLRERLRERLRQNAEVVGTDEAFFEEENAGQPLLDLYNERLGVLDEEPDSEIDLVSYAYQIWKNATDANPSLRALIPQLANVVYSTKPHLAGGSQVGPTGVLVYMNTNEGNSALAWIDQQGKSVSESQFTILRAAECALDTPALPRQEAHHELVQRGVDHMLHEGSVVGGQLGRPSGARFKSYERMKGYAESLRGTLWENDPTTQSLFKAIEQIYRYPLRESAREKLNRQLRSNVRNEQLAELIVNLYEDDVLCLVEEEKATEEAHIICSLGLATP
ncbi:MAG: NgoFVII family restriction endonuclease [Ardenticatenales bacterium]|nr:NgoFVII family restriction endonuclease [Ardenticatenales bacterium]